MDNLFWGIITITVCGCGYALSFQKQHRDDYNAALALLLFCGFLLRIYCSCDSHLHEWDERYHALVAKHLAEHLFKPKLYKNPLLPYSYNEWTTNHIWVHKQPLPLWLLAASIKLFGLHVWSVRIPSILMSTIGIKLIYDIGLYFYEERSAFIAAFLFSINGAIIELAAGRQATEHIDIAFMFFVLLGVWYSIKYMQVPAVKNVILIGFAVGAAVLCKWLPALIVIPFWLILIYGKASAKTIFFHLLIILTVTAAVFLPWQLFILKYYTAEALYEYQYNKRHIFEALSGQGGSFFYHFNYLRICFGELIYIPVLWFTCKAIQQKDKHGLAILVWFWLPYLFFSFCATKMYAYTLFAAPAIFLITAKAYYNFKDGVTNIPKWLTTVLAYGLLLLPVRYTIERVKPFTVLDRNPEWNVTIEKFAQSVNNNSKTVVFNCDHFIEMMYATEVVSYNYLPADSTINRLKKEGYTILVQDGITFNKSSL